MAGILFTRYVTKTSSSGAKGFRIRGTAPYSWTTLSRTTTALKTRRAALLLGLPALSCLAYQAYHEVQRSTVIHALEEEEVLEQSDYLYSCAETEKNYQLLLQHKDSDNAEFLWRLARASRDLSLLPDTKAEEKKQLVFKAFEYAKKALEKDDTCFAAHKWYAVCLSDVGDYEGVKVKIGNSYIIREHLEKAIKLNPKDATSLHILGYWSGGGLRWGHNIPSLDAVKMARLLSVKPSMSLQLMEEKCGDLQRIGLIVPSVWCFMFAELPWYQRKVAAVIFASPPTSTYEEALQFFLQAEEVDPNFYSKNLLMLGKTYLGMNDKQKALQWLSKAKDYPARTLEDKEVHKEAVDLLKKLK